MERKTTVIAQADVERQLDYCEKIAKERPAAAKRTVIASLHQEAKLMLKSAPDEALMELLSIYHEDIGAIMRYSVLCDLESIYLMKNDYEKAFDCSDEKQKMLSKIK
jgi:hypothetical protein